MTLSPELALLLVRVALAICIVEAVLMLVLRRRRGAPVSWLPNLAAGTALMLAVHEALDGASLHWVMVWLALGGVAHLVDVRSRMR